MPLSISRARTPVGSDEAASFADSVDAAVDPLRRRRASARRLRGRGRLATRRQAWAAASTVTPTMIRATPATWTRASRSPNRKNAATALIAANWLPMTATMAMLSRAPQADARRAEDLAGTGDDEQGQGGARQPQPAGQDDAGW